MLDVEIFYQKPQKWILNVAHIMESPFNMIHPLGTMNAQHCMAFHQIFIEKKSRSNWWIDLQSIQTTMLAGWSPEHSKLPNT